MTAKALRDKIVTQALSWLGVKEGSTEHKEILAIYNGHTPLARGYAIQMDDAWCAAFVSAMAIACGLTDIIPTEVSCTQMMKLFQKKGRWVEDDCYVPSPGDILFYDWEDSGSGDCTGAPNHVGIVSGVSGTTIYVIEGNYDNAVKERKLQVGGKYIRGYGVPDYASMATVEFSDVDPNAWYADAVAYVAAKGLMQGDGNGKFRPGDPVTRAELAAVIERLCKK